jgi:hypothetical protein
LSLAQFGYDGPKSIATILMNEHALRNAFVGSKVRIFRYVRISRARIVEADKRDKTKIPNDDGVILFSVIMFAIYLSVLIKYRHPIDIDQNIFSSTLLVFDRVERLSGAQHA